MDGAMDRWEDGFADGSRLPDRGGWLEGQTEEDEWAEAVSVRRTSSGKRWSIREVRLRSRRMDARDDTLVSV